MLKVGDRLQTLVGGGADATKNHRDNFLPPSDVKKKKISCLSFCHENYGLTPS